MKGCPTPVSKRKLKRRVYSLAVKSGLRLKGVDTGGTLLNI